MYKNLEQVKEKLKEMYMDDFHEDLIHHTVYFAFSTLIRLRNEPNLEEEQLKAIDLIWVMEFTRELLNREKKDAGGVISYSENGYSFTYDDSLISKGLRNLIFPRVGTIKRVS